VRDRQAELPRGIIDAFKEDVSRATSQGLRAMALSRDLLTNFDRAGLPLLFLKGQAVGQLAYGEHFLKTSADVDILVAPGDVESAALILGDLGYVVVVPGQREMVTAWHRRAKESVWVRPGFPPVELHSRVADHPSLLPTLSVSSPRQMVKVGSGMTVPTFGKDELFAYLAVHGASSAWFRLKWLCDLAALLSDAPETEVERLYRNAVELGAGRSPGLALLLCYKLFDTAVSPLLICELKADTALRILEYLAVQQLCDVREPTMRPLGTFGIHASQLLLRPGWRFAVSECWRQFRAFRAS
jgi:hypothetical protein